MSPSADTLANMVISLAQALACCKTANQKTACLLFDAAFVFVGTTGTLHFAFVPLDNLVAANKHSPLTLLEGICTLTLRTARDPSVLEIARRLGDYVRSEEGVFSLNALRDFVRTEFEVEIRADGTGVPRSHSRVGQKLMRRMLTGEEYELVEGSSMRLGRGGACSLQIQGNPCISREHAGVSVGEDGIDLWDLGSKNGVSVNGRRLLPGEHAHVLWGGSFYVDDEQMLLVSCDAADSSAL